MNRPPLLVLAALLSVSVLTPSSQAALDPAPAWVLPWYNGNIESIGHNIACLSDPPIVQTRVQGYAGFSMVPPNQAPGRGELFYTHLVLSHPGNPCGGSAVGVELLLPQGIELAISPSDPVYCFMVAPPAGTRPYAQLYNLAHDPDFGCPQTLPQGIEGHALVPPRGGWQGSHAWGMGQGFWLEFLVPLRASRSYWADANIRWRVNPDIGVVGYPSVPAFINGDVIFRSPMEGNVLMLDICGVSPTPAGC